MRRFREAVDVSNLGALTPTGNLQVVRPFAPGTLDDLDGDTCRMPDGTMGVMTQVDGRYTCQPTAPKENRMAKPLGEAVVAVRFTASSRTQIGKQYTIMDTHMRAVQGTGNLTISAIKGVPGNWFFDVSSPAANQFLNAKDLANKLVAGVSISTPASSAPQAAPTSAATAPSATPMPGAPGSPSQLASGPSVNSVRERVAAQAKAAREAAAAH